MSSSGKQINPSVIHQSTFDRLGQVERYFVDKWCKQGRYAVVPDEVPAK
jgi:hypothetical protein